MQIQEKPVLPTVEEYQNYAPTESSIIMRLSNDPSENVFTFEYILSQDIPYTVTYVDDETGKTVSGPHSYTSDAVIISVEADESLISGYEIIGSFIQKVNLSETKTVVFRVKAKTYSITYNGVGYEGITWGTMSLMSNPNPKEYSGDLDEAIQITNPNRPGYTFNGWDYTGHVAEGEEHNRMNTVISPGS